MIDCPLARLLCSSYELVVKSRTNSKHLDISAVEDLPMDGIQTMAPSTRQQHGEAKNNRVADDTMHNLAADCTE